MKKILLFAVMAVAVGLLAGCGSMRTPSGRNRDKIYYRTFFGISIESAVYGDGLVVHPVNN